MKRLFLAAGLIAAMTPATWAQDAKPAAPAAAQEQVSAREKAALGKFKSETPGAPAIEIKAMGKQLILAAEGYPELPVTLSEKDELIAQGLPEGFKFMVVRDKDGAITGLKIDTPMGASEYKRVGGTPAAPAKKPAIPDLLGKYESDEINGMKMISNVVYEKGKILIRSEGQPEFEVTLSKDDTLVATPSLPDGVTIKMTKDKDGKYIGSVVTSPQGELKFTRKTFPKPPTDEAPAAVAAIPDVLGKYEPAEAGPIGDITILYRDGMLVSTIEGQPDVTFTVDKDDNIVSKNLPEGVTAKFVKDKDGKVIKLVAKAAEGEMTFNRKTFPKPPAAPEKKTEEPTKKAEDPALAKLKAAEGIYTSETPGVPVVTMKIKDGKLFVEAEGNPEIEVTITDKDIVKGESLPDGFVLKLVRDKDGKVTGMDVETPMGNVSFTRKPLK